MRFLLKVQIVTQTCTTQIAIDNHLGSDQPSSVTTALRSPYVELSRLYQLLFVLIIYLPILAGLFHSALVAHPPISPQILLQSIVNWLPLSILWEAFAFIVNDIVDQNLDRTVERTRDRPIILPASSLLYYSLTAVGCVVYAYTKRFTYYAQAFLGVVHSLVSLFASYSIGFNAFDAPSPVRVSSLSLVGAVFFLVTTYEFIYAYQDREEDVKFGVKSMAVKYAHSGRKVLVAFSLTYAGLLIVSGFIATISLRVLYNIFLHPLSRYPGPISWTFTAIPSHIAHLKGTIHLRTAKLLKKYGPVVRVAPNELSYITAPAWTDIYARRHPEQLKKHPDIISGPSGGVYGPANNPVDHDHARRKRLLAPGFSEKAVGARRKFLQPTLTVSLPKFRMSKTTTPSI
ncbi:Para-hydroxybenzoate--polyprenyltransferase, mitochondrial precursor (PHB:polyprenyltransferase) [Aspergillus nanangensis]|uniref:Para-hydroxybenzoate--polyprenyltransferase, mitochondrial (PHB:polyprenyltransferase) n=1 Tax=Aspergillus nanangensis TaxID=2582783 RepID=A0AAD4CX96_ASPNN|nr:Para-hydroxybenzoate--polyprenyltransferase, mitochondrial precursor (PHB:polyprenyltransferase) [Aspergillus nanangensis]